MTLLAFLLLSQTPTPQAILARYAEYRTKHPALEVHWSVNVANQQKGEGTLAVDGDKRALFKANNQKDHYSLSETELGIVELAPARETYDEIPAQPKTIVFSSRLSGAIQFVPGPVMRSRITYPGDKTPYEYAGKTTVNGKPADVVRWAIQTRDGLIYYQTAIDQDGRLVKFKHSLPSQSFMSPPSSAKPSATAPGDTRWIEWTLSDYRPIDRPLLAMYATPVPQGFTPYALPDDSNPTVEVDGRLPATAWTRGSEKVDLAKEFSGHPGLVLVTTPDSLPGRLALSNLPSLQKALANSGAMIEMASLTRNASEAEGQLFDPSGKAIDALGATATPLYILVNSAGKITNLWTGYDPARSTQFVHEVATAVAQQSAK
jgi:hypothetical protein